MSELLSVVTIDGPAGAGKSTVAREVARLLGVAFLDTGAMYRAVTWKALSQGVDPLDGDAVTAVACALEIAFGASGEVFADGEDVTVAIRSAEVTGNVSAVSAHAGVRVEMAARQRRIGEGTVLVCEGRDMGSDVFPDAVLRIYLDASVEVRAMRRRLELEAKGQTVDDERLRREIVERDRADSERAENPLRRVEGQVFVDSSDMTREQVIEDLLGRARESLGR